MAEKSDGLGSTETSQTFIESYLMEMNKNDSENNGKVVFSGASANGIRSIASRHSTSFPFSEEQLLSLCVDFVQAGTETTSNTLSFGLMYMIHNKRVSDKVHDELDAVVGRTRLPNLNDRSKLPYLEAVLCEIQRFASVAPLAIAHRATETIKFFDYVIPKDSVTLVSLYSMNMDEEYWKDPHVFRPERFLNENGQLIQHSEQFIPFGLGEIRSINRNRATQNQLLLFASIGKRRCVGENIARWSLFMYFATFMHAFEMIVPDGVGLPDIKPLDGITLQPKSFQIKLIRRI